MVQVGLIEVCSMWNYSGDNSTIYSQLHILFYSPIQLGINSAKFNMDQDDCSIQKRECNIICYLNQRSYLIYGSLQYIKE